ncbi:hypothetical protein BDD12DRAFT_909985 [Trichophaea hybrida]|nr:hypothetical protein BDD12DRAFT_909985 [Trichophaea hybrida]
MTRSFHHHFSPSYHLVNQPMDKLLALSPRIAIVYSCKFTCCTLLARSNLSPRVSLISKTHRNASNHHHDYGLWAFSEQRIA